MAKPYPASEGPAPFTAPFPLIKSEMVSHWQGEPQQGETRD